MEEWELQANCNGHDFNIFFPEDTDDPVRSKNTAIAICNRCPVRQKCLEYALVHQIDYGIWGGTDGLQRKKLRVFEPWRTDGKESKPIVVGRPEKIDTKPRLGTGAKRGKIYA